jgi:hypothetical protein
VHLLRPRPAPITGFLRIGHTGHKQLAAVHAPGRFPFRLVVFEAAYVAGQLDLLNPLQSVGCEIVLDPNFAEAAAIDFRGGGGAVAAILGR